MELIRSLPTKIGQFHRVGPVRPLELIVKEGLLGLVKIGGASDAGPFGGEVNYQSESGDKFLVELVRLRSDSDAYSLLTFVARRMRETSPNENISLDSAVGTASAASSRDISFFKGADFVRVTRIMTRSSGRNESSALGELLAGQLDKGDGDIPALIKHLPDWESARKQAVFLSGFTSLETVESNQPVLAAVESTGDSDAVVADYGPARLLIIEFNTPQLAGDNDRRIAARIHEFSSLNQPGPTAYRRVGNYCVFVFNGADEKTANELINQVKYEQVVQWLGDNPYWFKEAEKRYVNTTLGVLVAVVKASGLSLLACLGLGGFFGALLFSRRRAQQAAEASFSDAGGMLRLNLDEMTQKDDRARLLGGHN